MGKSEKMCRKAKNALEKIENMRKKCETHFYPRHPKTSRNPETSGFPFNPDCCGVWGKIFLKHVRQRMGVWLSNGQEQISNASAEKCHRKITGRNKRFQITWLQAHRWALTSHHCCGWKCWRPHNSGRGLAKLEKKTQQQNKTLWLFKGWRIPCPRHIDEAKNGKHNKENIANAGDKKYLSPRRELWCMGQIQQTPFGPNLHGPPSPVSTQRNWEWWETEKGKVWCR